MKSLNQSIKEYIAMRQGLGYKLECYSKYLHEFAAFLEATGEPVITPRRAIEYATRNKNEQPTMWSLRLAVIRGFARYRIHEDPRTVVPSSKLLPARRPRARPYFYSKKEIRCLLTAAKDYCPKVPIQGRTVATFLGLLAVTGLRVGEACRLMCEDVDLDAGTLLIRDTKFLKSRYIPLHKSTIDALKVYSVARDAAFKKYPRTYFFRTLRGGRVHESAISHVFRTLCVQTGIRKLGAHTGPRLHDFRHRFAVETLIGAYRSGRNIHKIVPRLATYLGHKGPSSTYWYLQHTPELMGAVTKLLERFRSQGGEHAA